MCHKIHDYKNEKDQPKKENAKISMGDELAIVNTQYNKENKTKRKIMICYNKKKSIQTYITMNFLLQENLHWKLLYLEEKITRIKC